MGYDILLQPVVEPTMQFQRLTVGLSDPAHSQLLERCNSR